MPKIIPKSIVKWGIIPVVSILSTSCSFEEVIAQGGWQRLNINPTPPQEIVQSNPDPEMLEQQVHQLVNQYRVSRNLPPLTLDARISQGARIHSQVMSRQDSLSHDNFEERVQIIAKTISYRSVAENVAFNSGYSNPANQAVQGWRESTGHRRNMEGDFDLTGVGIVKNRDGKYFFTQIFWKLP